MKQKVSVDVSVDKTHQVYDLNDIERRIKLIEEFKANNSDETIRQEVQNAIDSGVEPTLAVMGMANPALISSEIPDYKGIRDMADDLLGGNEYA